MYGVADTVNEAFYTGDSMRGMFVPGETLRLAEMPFERLRTGDVVMILDRSPHVVHRVVEKNAAYAVTMGDNNARPDALNMTPDSSFRVVTEAVSADGEVRPVVGGEDGMRQFRRQQRNRKLRRLAAWAVRPLKPLKFLRIPARRTERFRDGTVQWSFGSIPVAARSPSGRMMYLHWSKRLFFRVPEEPGREVRS